MFEKLTLSPKVGTGEALYLLYQMEEAGIVRVNLKTFEIVSLFVFALGVFCALSVVREVRVIGYLQVLFGGYLFYQVMEERKRRRRRCQFRHRMERLLAA